MNPKKKWKGRAHRASAEEVFARALLGDEPYEDKPFDPREDRKTRQLCQQVRRSLMLALAGECDDDVLRDVYVESVEPLGGASQLLVRVAVPPSVELPVWQVVARLNNQGKRLRAIVAHSICRKRVPTLCFVAIPDGLVFPDGGVP